jgi:hypothetical protein
MRHISAISRRPAKAQDITAGQILTVIVGILGVLAQALTAKENA